MGRGAPPSARDTRSRASERRHPPRARRRTRPARRRSVDPSRSSEEGSERCVEPGSGRRRGPAGPAGARECDRGALDRGTGSGRRGCRSPRGSRRARAVRCRLPRVSMPPDRELHPHRADPRSRSAEVAARGSERPTEGIDRVYRRVQRSSPTSSSMSQGLPSWIVFDQHGLHESGATTAHQGSSSGGQRLSLDATDQRSFLRFAGHDQPRRADLH